ncbi:hypothetical protein JCM10449v2_000194 [Rhodotorula kratochvilovae]
MLPRARTSVPVSSVSEWLRFAHTSATSRRRALPAVVEFYQTADALVQPVLLPVSRRIEGLLRRIADGTSPATALYNEPEVAPLLPPAEQPGAAVRVVKVKHGRYRVQARGQTWAWPVSPGFLGGMQDKLAELHRKIETLGEIIKSQEWLNLMMRNRERAAKGADAWRTVALELAFEDSRAGFTPEQENWILRKMKPGHLSSPEKLLNRVDNLKGRFASDFEDSPSRLDLLPDLLRGSGACAAIHIMKSTTRRRKTPVSTATRSAHPSVPRETIIESYLSAARNEATALDGPGVDIMADALLRALKETDITLVGDERERVLEALRVADVEEDAEDEEAEDDEAADEA